MKFVYSICILYCIQIYKYTDEQNTRMHTTQCRPNHICSQTGMA